jgi:hypothetical protein
MNSNEVLMFIDKHCYKYIYIGQGYSLRCVVDIIHLALS